MEIETLIGRTHVTLRIRGRVTRADGFQLKRTIARLLEEGHRQFVVSLGEVTDIDSFGLGDLVAASAAASRAGGRISFESAGSRVGALLSKTKLLAVHDRKPARGWTKLYLWLGAAVAVAAILWMLIRAR
jgi:anti-anti-sigma factor